MFRQNHAAMLGLGIILVIVLVSLFGPYIYTVAPRDIPAGTAQVALHFAAEVQSIDVGPVYVFKTE